MADHLTVAEQQQMIKERDADEETRCEHGHFADDRCEDCEDEKGHLSWWSPSWKSRE